MHSTSMELQPPKLEVTHVLAQSGRPQMLALSCRLKGLEWLQRPSACPNVLSTVAVQRIETAGRMMELGGLSDRLWRC
jgi:hypothetical protein